MFARDDEPEAKLLCACVCVWSVRERVIDSVTSVVWPVAMECR
jgi:hypothetical protein